MEETNFCGVGFHVLFPKLWINRTTHNAHMYYTYVYYYMYLSILYYMKVKFAIKTACVLTLTFLWWFTHTMNWFTIFETIISGIAWYRHFCLLITLMIKLKVIRDDCCYIFRLPSIWLLPPNLLIRWISPFALHTPLLSLHILIMLFRFLGPDVFFCCFSREFSCYRILPIIKITVTELPSEMASPASMPNWVFQSSIDFILSNQWFRRAYLVAYLFCSLTLSLCFFVSRSSLRNHQKELRDFPLIL